MRYEELTIEGRNAVLEAFRSGKTVDKLFVLDGCQDGPVQGQLAGAQGDIAGKQSQSSEYDHGSGEKQPGTWMNFHSVVLLLYDSILYSVGFLSGWACPLKV